MTAALQAIPRAPRPLPGSRSARLRTARAFPRAPLPADRKWTVRPRRPARSPESRRAKTTRNRRREPDRRVRRRRRQQHHAHRHQSDTQHHRRPAPGAVRVSADHDASERAGDEADPERGNREQQADERIVRGKKRAPDHHREERIGGEVVKLERVAQHRCDYGTGRDPRLRFVRVSAVVTRKAGVSAMLADRGYWRPPPIAGRK